MNAANPNIASETELETIRRELRECLDVQRSAYLAQPMVSYQQRKADLLALKRLVVENQEALITAICEDYGNRSKHETIFAEIVTVLQTINDAVKQLKSWMKPQRRKIDFTLYPGAKNRVYPQPLGVVGMIVPWNFPINLSMTGLVSVFAAGNRAMIKMSENSRALTRLLIDISPKYFAHDKLAFFEETGGVGIEFSQLPFDHLIFTGSGQTGRKVMAAAAQNLVPVTLELGGKCPAIIAPDYDLAKAVERIMFVKLFNAGQICTNVDYVFVPSDKRQPFIDLCMDYVQQHCPDINSPDFTSIIDDVAYRRVLETIDDAKDKGATVINMQPEQVSAEGMRKVAPHLILDTTEEMNIRHRETFGPLLMVHTYDSPQQAIDYINHRDRPLAIYPFSNDKALIQRYIDSTMSGGVSVNDALFHVAQHDLPFGGVGASGMGHYHGFDGFLTFSKLRPVFYQAPVTAMKFLAPPYGNFATKMLNFLTKFNSR
ncbi:MAG TPA: coniferyl aldehyde dehydrogenase [Pseudomonadales bacterium]|nr:coniferyl aldehyde dehydrogenase [Pseudomonadales bacterium]